MAIFRVNRHTGCIICYNKNSIELVTGEQVDYEVFEAGAYNHVVM